MKKVCVDPGGSRTEKYKAAVRLQSQCKQIAKLAAEISEFDFMNSMRGAFGQNQIFLSGARCKFHPSCPIPIASVKAVEACNLARGSFEFICCEFGGGGSSIR